MAARKAATLPIVALAFLTACGGDEVTTSGSTSGDPPPPPQVDMGHPPRAEPPANIVGGFKIEIPPTTLAPGEEVTPCWIFPLDLMGPSHMVGGGSVTVGQGMHHGNITTRPKTGDGIRPCPANEPGIGGSEGDVFAGGTVLFGSSTQTQGTEWQSFPDGMAYHINDGQEIVARMHYLNVTPDSLTVAPVYEWYTVDESKVTQEISPFAWALRNFQIPPNSEYTAKAECDFPHGMHIVNVLPHMHAMGRLFTAGYLGGELDGKLFLDSRGYDPDNGVMVQYDKGIDLSQGDGATFSCTWKNSSDKVIVEGIGDNEMCILFGYAYPPEQAYTALATETGCIYVAPPTP